MIVHQITNYSQLLLEWQLSAPLTNEKMKKYPDPLHELKCLALSDIVKNYVRWCDVYLVNSNIYLEEE